jgi:hypothetical protein
MTTFVIVVFVLWLVGGGLLVYRGWRSTVFMSDGMSGWSRGAPLASSDGRATVFRRRSRMTLVPLQVSVEVFAEGCVISTPMSRLEANRSELELRGPVVTVRRSGWRIDVSSVSSEAFSALERVMRDVGDADS